VSPLFPLALALLCGAPVQDVQTTGDDQRELRGWPTVGRDARRGGATPEQLALPLTQHWVHRARHRPAPSWGAPAGGSHWQQLTNLAPRVTFDRAEHPVALDGRVFLASSSDDQVRCLDLATGAELWRFLAGGPVRLAPALTRDGVFFGSDDGNLYRLDARDGSLVWKVRAAPGPRLVAGRGRLVSAWPVRTGVVVDGGRVYATSGLFPALGVQALALDADSGAEIWRAPIEAGVSPQGYLVASADRLYMPNGRAAPFVIDRADGSYLGTFGGPGGAWALLADEGLISGPSDDGELALASTGNRDRLASFRGRRMVVTEDGWSVLQSDTGLSALLRSQYLELLAERDGLRRESAAAAEGEDTGEVERLGARLAELDAGLRACVPWSRVTSHTDSLVVAGDLVLAGGDGEVAAFSRADGEQLWSAPVEGRALGLAVCEGRLLVATDRGVLHAFAPGPAPVATPAVPSVLITDAPSDQWIRALDRTLERLPHRMGFALLLGVRDLGVLQLLVEQSHLALEVVPAPDVDAAALRARLADATLLGRRAVVVETVDGRVPVTDYLANLVVRLDASFSAEEALRLARPADGVIVGPDGAATLRPPLAGAGDWSHAYAGPGNTACSGDLFAGSELDLQWFGGPGPSAMIDRHLRTAPPLEFGGRLYLPASDRVIAVDAYNGTVLWERELPGLSRTGFPYDGGYLAARAAGLLCAVGHEALLLDADTGEVSVRFAVPQAAGLEDPEWGWLATVGDALYGSAQPAGASRRAQSRDEVLDQYAEDRPLVVGQALFRRDLPGGELRWCRPGVSVLSTSLAVAENRLLYLESDVDVVPAEPAGRATLAELSQRNPRLVALDVETGEELWSVPFEPREERHVLYLAAEGDSVVTVGSFNAEGRNRYRVRVFDAADGRERWTAVHGNNRSGVGGDHGEQVHHPVLRGRTLIAEPVAYDLDTGALVDPTGGAGWSLPARSGCGTLSASASHLYFRDGVPTAVDLSPGGTGRRKLTGVTRPGCWINVLPAGGLVLLPEASSGCVCAYPVQTSLALAPRR